MEHVRHEFGFFEGVDFMLLDVLSITHFMHN